MSDVAQLEPLSNSAKAHLSLEDHDEAPYLPLDFDFQQAAPIDSETARTGYDSFSLLLPNRGYSQLSGQDASVQINGPHDPSDNRIGIVETPDYSQLSNVRELGTCVPYLDRATWHHSNFQRHGNGTGISKDLGIAKTAHEYRNSPASPCDPILPDCTSPFSLQKPVLRAPDAGILRQFRDEHVRITHQTTSIPNRPIYPVNNAISATAVLKSPSTTQQYTFVPEDPSRKLTVKESRQRKVAYDEEHWRKQQALKEAGGSCIWCSQIKKGCDDKETCSNCVRPVYGNGGRTKGERRRALDSARLGTFAKAQKLARMLHSELKTPIPAGHAILQCRWHYPNLSGLIVLDRQLLLTPLENYRLPDDMRESLIKTTLSIIPQPALFDGNNAEHSKIRKTSIEMLGIATFIISAARSELFVRPCDLFGGRVVFLYLFTYLVQVLAQLSEEFSVQLLRLLRLKRTEKHDLDDIFLSTGIYYRVLSGLCCFAPGSDSMLEEIFSAMREQLNGSISMIEALLSSDDLVGNSIAKYSKMSQSVKTEKFWTYFDERVPPLPILDDMQISLYFYDKASSPVPTALLRHFHPFCWPSPVTVPHLMSFKFNESFDFPANRSPPVPGPDVVSFANPPRRNDLPFLTSALGTWVDTKPSTRAVEEANKSESEIILSGLDAESSDWSYFPFSNDLTLVPTESSAQTIVESIAEEEQTPFKSIDCIFEIEKFLFDYGNRCIGGIKRASSICSRLADHQHSAKRPMYELDI